MKDNYRDSGEVECILVKTKKDWNYALLTRDPGETFDDCLCDTIEHICEKMEIGIYRMTLSFWVDSEIIEDESGRWCDINGAYYKLEKSIKLMDI